MNQDERLNPTPEEEGASPSPSESSEKKVDSTPISEESAVDVSVAENPPAEAPREILQTADQPANSEAVDAVNGASPLEQAPVYRWTYADQVAHEAAVSTSKHRKGMLIYAAVMTGVFLVSFALLMAVLLTGNRGSGGSGIVLRPGITAEDDEAVAGVEQAKHSVVVIETKTATGGGVGTGIIMTEDGYIATNHHVVDKAVSIKVTFYNGTTMQAELIGSSEMDDLAVIKVRTSGLTAAKFADMENCFVGQTVYAIGTPSSADFGWSTTKGIISYKNREVKMYDEDGTLKKKLRLIQTDANVNPGNSGGPLINTNGEVIGVVSMRMADGFEGIGFAIPSDGAIEVLNAIIEHGNADNINSSLSHKRPMLGITGVYVTGGAYYLPNDTGVQLITEEELESYDKSKLLHPEVSGIYVMSFAAGMDAATKMSVGDIITAAQGDEIDSMDHLMDIINDYYAGDTITLTVYRNGRYIPVDILLSEKPNS